VTATPSTPSRRTRRNGEGTIGFHKASGRWRWGYYDANHKRKYLTHKSREGLQALVDVALGDRAKGVPAPDRATRLGPWLTRWLDTMRPDQARPSTMRSYRARAHQVALDPIGRRKLADLRASDLEAFLARRAERGNTPTVLGQYLRFLRAALDAAMRDQLLGMNVARLVRTPRALPRDSTMPTEEEVRTLRSAYAGGELEGVLELLVTTGMRIGEALALQWKHVHLAAEYLEVLGTLDGATTRTVGPTKSRQGRRVVYLTDPRIVATLQAHRARTWGRDITPLPSAWVFPHPVHPSRPMRAEMVLDRFRAICRGAHVRELRLHDLRHVAATRMVADPRNTPEDVARVLGHTPEMLLRVYVHREVRPVYLSPEAPSVAG
jgi:integrase